MEVRNIFTLVTFNCSIDLILLGVLFLGETHGPKCFNIVSILLNCPTFGQTSENGEAIVNSGHSKAHFLVGQYQRALWEVGFTAEIIESEVVNNIATYTFGCRLNVIDVIDEIYRLLFEPKPFPAVRILFLLHEVTVDIFIRENVP